MSQVNVLIGLEPFVLKKGIQFILNEIENYAYYFQNPENDIEKCIRTHKIDILICNNLFFIKNKKSLSKIKTVIIDYENKNFSEYFININETDKSVINNVLQQAGKNKLKESGKKEEISEREIAVVKCIAKGMTNKEIAEKLFISQHTVITHRKNITRKLGIKTVSGLTVYAILNNIIDINEVN